MVDIQSATVSLAATAPTSATASLTSVQATVTTVPPALASLDHAIQINATPAAIASANEITLITALGSVTVTLAAQIGAAEKQILLQQLLAITQAQKPITLSLQPGTPPTQAVLLVPNLSLPATTPVQNASALSPAPVVPPPALAVGETLSAIVLPSLPPQGSATLIMAPQSAAPTGTADINFAPAAPISVQFDPVLSRTIASSSTQPSPQAAPLAAPVIPDYVVIPLETLPSPTLHPIPVTQAAATAPPTTSAILPTAQSVTAASAQTATPTTQAQSIQQTPATQSVSIQPAQAAQPVPLLQPGSAVTVRVDAIIAPLPQSASAPVPPVLPPLAPNQIAATVTGTGTEGQLILKAGDTVLFVKTPAAAPIGSTVILTVETAKPDPLLVLPQNTPTNFQALPQAVAALAQSDPQTLAQMVATRLPQPTQYLPGALLFLFSAFKQGNVGDWLGENAASSLLNMGKSDIVASLSHELGSAGQIVQDPVVGEWRTYPIPLYSSQQFHALTLYVHSDRDARKDQTAAAPAAGKIRFLIDMRLSRLGAMQVDGFVQSKKLDMILRSETTLPGGLHNELRTAYINALGAVGFTGALNFQVGRQHWMRMQKPAARGIVT